MTRRPKRKRVWHCPYGHTAEKRYGHWSRIACPAVREWEKMTDFLRLIMWSAFVENGRPQSVFLVGPPGLGKTEAIMRFQSNPWIDYYSDITYQRLLAVARRVGEGTVTHLAITEFQKVLGRRRSVAESTITGLLQATEDGIGRAGFGPIEREYGGARFGLFAASTPRSVQKHPYLVYDFALDSRVFFVDASSTRDEVDEMRRHIADGDKSMLRTVTIKRPEKKVRVELPPALGHKVIGWVKQMEQTKNVRVYGYRTQVRFNYALMGVALSHGRDVVRPADLDELEQFKGYWLRPVLIPEDPNA